MPNMLDVMKRTGTDESVGLLEESIQTHPELDIIEARTISGFQFDVLKRSELPTVAFRKANEGTDAVNSKYSNEEVKTFIVNAQIKCDKVIADRAEDGRAGYITDEQAGVLESTNRLLCSKFYYGDGKNDDFVGLQNFVDASMIVNAEGTGNALSSVYAVKTGTQDVKFIFGDKGSFNFTDVKEETITGSNDKDMPGYTCWLELYPGLQLINKHSVACINHLNATDKGLNDDMLAELINKFPAGYTPDAIFMTRRSRMQLQKSRQAVNATGAPVPTPTEYEGIKIVITDSLVNTESAW